MSWVLTNWLSSASHNSHTPNSLAHIGPPESRCVISQLICIFLLWKQGTGANFVQFSQQALVKRGIVELLLTSDDENQVLKGATEGGTSYSVM